MIVQFIVTLKPATMNPFSKMTNLNWKMLLSLDGDSRNRKMLLSLEGDSRYYQMQAIACRAEALLIFLNSLGSPNLFLAALALLWITNLTGQTTLEI